MREKMRCKLVDVCGQCRCRHYKTPHSKYDNCLNGLVCGYGMKHDCIPVEQPQPEVTVAAPERGWAR